MILLMLSVLMTVNGICGSFQMFACVCISVNSDRFQDKCFAHANIAKFSAFS